MVFDYLWQYEELNSTIEAALHRLLEETHYNTVNNFIAFYQAYKQSGTHNLMEFFRNYEPPINRRHHMCVSLGMEIVSRLIEVCPGIGEHLYLVSCEEAVESVQPYIDNCQVIENSKYSLEKEHALIAMKIIVAGGRIGYMILDPGYHVSRAVTIMQDQLFPHTGWFIQSDEPQQCKREYCYTMSTINTGFIEWSERTTRGSDNKQTHEISLVYVERPYRTAIDVTVRRNLVYNFRSLLSRNAKGRVCSGIYFPVVNEIGGGGDVAQLTLFYIGANDTSVKLKQKFSVFKDLKKIPDNVMNHLEPLSAQLKMKMEQLLDILKSLTEIMYDQTFLMQTLAINNNITRMSADN